MNEADLNACLLPQERFAALSAVAFRRFGRRLTDLAYANVYDGPNTVVRQALQAAAAEEKELSFQYTPYGGRTLTRRLIASKLREEYGVRFDYRDVIMTTGAMAALNITLRALFGPRDEVIVLTPCWLDYPLYLTNLGIQFRFVALREDKHLDLRALENALTSHSRGILFSQPCCPTGVCYSREEIQNLGRLLSEAELHFGIPVYLISDEVHRQIIWSRSEFYSPLLTYPRTLIIYSFGKALFLQGQRIGYVAVSPRLPERAELRRQLTRYVQAMGFCTPTALMQSAIDRLVDYRPQLDVIAMRQGLMRTKLKSFGYEVCDAEATFFIYVKSPFLDDWGFTEYMANAGVLVLPSTLFHERGYFRISVTARIDTITAALDQFDRAMQDRWSGHYAAKHEQEKSPLGGKSGRSFC
jgi:aspartate aminotransferase